MEASQRSALTGAGESIRDQSGYWIARAFLCAVAFGVLFSSCELWVTRQFADLEVFFRDASIAEIPNVLGIFDFSPPACRALAVLTAGRFSECCFRLNGIFSRELSRSLVDKGLLVTTPIASDPPNRASN